MSSVEQNVIQNVWSIIYLWISYIYVSFESDPFAFPVMWWGWRECGFLYYITWKIVKIIWFNFYQKSNAKLSPPGIRDITATIIFYLFSKQINKFGDNKTFANEKGTNKIYHKYPLNRKFNCDEGLSTSFRRRRGASPSG